MKNIKKYKKINQQHLQQSPIINWTYYSSLEKLVRHLTWILRLKSNWVEWKKGLSEREHLQFLTVDEL